MHTQKQKQLCLLVTDATTTKFAGHVRDWIGQYEFDAIFPRDNDPATLLALAPPADAILCYQAELTSTIIDAAPHLRFIQKHGLNCRNIDLAAAARRGIPVATAPLMRNLTVAEHALAMMLACSRKVIDGHRAVTTAAYMQMGLQPMTTTQANYRANWAGMQGMKELYQSTVGIIGMGDIGIEIAKRCRVFGMDIGYHQRTRLPQIETELGMTYRGLNDLLATADYIVLALPHTPQTEGMINAKTLACMKSSATLINVGRGGLVDEAALVDALNNGRLAMAALDVYQQEPLPAHSPLCALPNVLLLPHTGGGSYRSWEVDMPAALSNIQRYFAGESVSGIVQI